MGCAAGRPRSIVLFDPDNESIQTNLAAFANAVDNADHATWKIEEDSALKVEVARRGSELELVDVP